ncbi:DUF461 domain-containing protein [Streptomyces sp. NPDC052236]|uniref:DUF461 domain-containing protein n=1 Tax=Streptomyces sp. NPDC052236 TaxID=3365686 RepID=UPI0037CE211F
MSRSLRRGALAATAIVFSITLLSACGAGTDAQTLGVRPDNAATTVDKIKIQNATVITQPELEAEGPAAITATIFNNGSKSETIDTITLPGTDLEVKLSPAQGSGPITVPPNGSVIIGGAGNASAVIENGREAAEGGGVQEVVFRLSKTGDVKLQAFVVPAKGYYAGYGPSSLPSPPAEPAAAPSPSGTPTGTATGEAGATGEPEAGESGEPSDGNSASASASASTSASASGEAAH